MAPFERTVGAGADIKELEYIAALHQTCMPNTRANGTISSLDIQRYLMSRHGLEITHGQAKDIIRGLGGGSLSKEVIQMIVDPSRMSWLKETMTNQKRRLWNEKTKAEQIREEAAAAEAEGRTDDNLVDDKDLYHPKFEYLDLVQLVSIILIPTFARFGKRWRDERIDLRMSLNNHSAYWSKLDEQNPSQSSVEVELGPDGQEEKQVDDFGEALEDLKRKLAETVGNVSKGDVNGGIPALDPEPRDLIHEVLRMLWKDLEISSIINSEEHVTGKIESGENWRQIEPPVMCAKLVETLLLENGEYERAKDRDLIQRMVQAAYSPSGRFDEEAFINALTSDLSAWRVGCEDRETTYIYDVFGTDDLKKFDRLGEKGAVNSHEDLEAQESDTNTVELHKKRSLKFVDSVVDMYASSVTLLLIWLFFLSVASMYTGFVKAANFKEASCKLKGDHSFGCTLLSTLYTWYVL